MELDGTSAISSIALQFLYREKRPLFFYDSQKLHALVCAGNDSESVTGEAKLQWMESSIVWANEQFVGLKSTSIMVPLFEHLLEDKEITFEGDFDIEGWIYSVQEVDIKVPVKVVSLIRKTGSSVTVEDKVKQDTEGTQAVWSKRGADVLKTVEPAKIEDGTTKRPFIDWISEDPHANLTDLSEHVKTLMATDWYTISFLQASVFIHCRSRIIDI